MAGIFPVVRVGTELTHSTGRSTYEADIRVDLVGKHQILIAIVEGADLYARPWVCLEISLPDTLASKAIEVVAGEVFHARTLTDLLELGLHISRDILNLVYEGDDDTFGRKLFGEALRPVAIL